MWEIEHGPKGGDELNLIEPGKNYGWPLVSYGINYNGVPIPSPDTRPDLTKPVIYWMPVIAPGNLMFYHGAMFPQWEGSALASGLGSKTLTRITFDGKGGATPAERWDVGHRIRDVEVASRWRAVDARGFQDRRSVPRDAEGTLSLLVGCWELGICRCVYRSASDAASAYAAEGDTRDLKRVFIGTRCEAERPLKNESHGVRIAARLCQPLFQTLAGVCPGHR